MNPIELLRPVHALTFDCYGTMIDWEAGILAALRPVLTARGLKLKATKVLALYAEFEAKAEAGPYRPYREVLAEVVRAFGRRFGVEPSEDETASLAASLPSWKPFPDAPQSRRRLKKRYRMAVISNIDTDLFEGARRELGVDWDLVVTAGDAKAYKPAARPFELAFAGLKLPSERVLHVAQSLYHDVAPARDLGLSTAWVNRRRGLRGTGATPRCDAVPDLEVPDLKTLADLLC